MHHLELPRRHPVRLYERLGHTIALIACRCAHMPSAREELKNIAVQAGASQFSYLVKKP